jgi:hypothetical protein
VACARAAARDPVLFLPTLFCELSAMLLRGLVRKAAASARELLRRWWFGGVTGESLPPQLPLVALALALALAVVGDSSSGDVVPALSAVAAAVLLALLAAVLVVLALLLLVPAVAALAVAASVLSAAATAAEAGDSSGAGGALCRVLLLCTACCGCCWCWWCCACPSLSLRPCYVSESHSYCSSLRVLQLGNICDG